CMLRLQQYEMLTKAVLIDHAQSGSMHNWEARRQARITEFRKLTLGQLVGRMQTSYLSKEGDGEAGTAVEPPAGFDQIWFSFKGSMQMDATTLARTATAMQELVELRNDLVHHLLEQFNIWELEGCSAASAHLDESYERIDRHMLELGAWAKSMVEAMRLHAGFMASDGFLEMITAPPDESPAILNQHSPIVESLRQAEQTLARDGWTFLDDAIALIGKSSKDEFPARYRRKKWRQVLEHSEAFAIDRRAVPDRAGTFTFYRTKP
ncbi:MAG: hypothetical protein ABIQ82_02795, partial [Variovorax sp.]